MEPIKISEDTNPALSARIDQARRLKAEQELVASLPTLEAQQAAEAESRRLAELIERQREAWQIASDAQQRAAAELVAASRNLQQALMRIRVAKTRIDATDPAAEQALRALAESLDKADAPARPKHVNDTWVTVADEARKRQGRIMGDLVNEAGLAWPMTPTLSAEIVEILNR